MLTPFNINSVRANVSSNMMYYMQMMIGYKTFIQSAIRSQLTAQEERDIQECHLNYGCIKKLATLGKQCYEEGFTRSDEDLFCICMAIGTIIKEYDWGIDYILPDGLCELASMMQ